MFEMILNFLLNVLPSMTIEFIFKSVGVALVIVIVLFIIYLVINKKAH